MNCSKLERNLTSNDVYQCERMEIADRVMLSEKEMPHERGADRRIM